MTAPGHRPTSQPRQSAGRPFLLPLAAGLVLLSLVREGLPRIWPGVSAWFVFAAALAVGYAAYAGTEWYLRRRRHSGSRQP